MDIVIELHKVSYEKAREVLDWVKYEVFDSVHAKHISFVELRYDWTEDPDVASVV